ncbi:MAG TPA: YfhO family protein, partial [Verrucomicrobiae bacterium]|nr:YfhO family protein [Verrucomicrobiae bacterium]
QLAFVTYPVKYLLLVAFITPLLAAFAIVRIRDHERAMAIVGIVLLIALTGVLLWLPRSSMANTDAHAAVLNGFSRVAFLIFTGIVFFALIRSSEAASFRAAPVILILVAWLDVLTHEPTQNPTVSPGIYQPGLARQQLAIDPLPELGRSRAMVSPKAFMQFIQLALRDPAKNYLVKRLGYCADCNLLDAVPKVDGFFSLTPRDGNDLFSLIYGATNDFPHLDDFMGVSQITASDEIYHWLPRKSFLPLVTAGQKPFLMDDWNTLHLLTDSNFDGSKMVFIAPEDRPFLSVTNAANARIVNSKFGDSKVEIEVEATAPAVVVVAQTFYHDWHVSVDGQYVRLLRANHAFQAVEVPQGRHQVVLHYADSAFECGAVISIFAWVGCLIGLKRL